MGSLISSSWHRGLYGRDYGSKGNRGSRARSCATCRLALLESKRRSFRVKGEVTRGLLRAALAMGLVLGLSGCGQYQGWTRYDCQLFENWEKPECNPPQCKAQGICTEDILGEHFDDKASETINE